MLGKFPSYLNLAEEMSANKFSIPSGIWNKMSAAEQWTANKKFLNRAIARGDEFVLSNQVSSIKNVSGSFRKELDHLLENGYVLDETGTRIIKK